MGAPPCVHFYITSITIPIHPSGMTGPIPLGDAHLSQLMRASMLRSGVWWWGLEDGPFCLMDDDFPNSSLLHCFLALTVFTIYLQFRRN